MPYITRFWNEGDGKKYERVTVEWEDGVKVEAFLKGFKYKQCIPIRNKGSQLCSEGSVVIYTPGYPEGVLVDGKDATIMHTLLSSLEVEGWVREDNVLRTIRNTAQIALKHAIPIGVGG